MPFTKKRNLILPKKSPEIRGKIVKNPKKKRVKKSPANSDENKHYLSDKQRRKISSHFEDDNKKINERKRLRRLTDLHKGRRPKAPPKNRSNGHIDGFYTPYGGYLDCTDEIHYHDSALLRAGGYTKRVKTQNLAE